jgi:hypothetical protein
MNNKMLVTEINKMKRLSGLSEDKYTIDTDCREEVGITVGLIDSIISTCRVLRPRLSDDSDQITGALEDLYDDEDLKYILDYLKKSKSDD